MMNNWSRPQRKVKLFYYIKILWTRKNTLFTHLECPRGWREYAGHCYLLLKNNRKEEDCRVQCFRLGSDLASILNQEENDFLVQYINERPARDRQIGKVGN